MIQAPLLQTVNPLICPVQYSLDAWTTPRFDPWVFQIETFQIARNFTNIAYYYLSYCGQTLSFNKNNFFLLLQQNLRNTPLNDHLQSQKASLLVNLSNVFESSHKGKSIVIKKYFKDKTDEFIREKHVLRSMDHESIIKPVFIGRSRILGFDFKGISLDLAMSANIISSSSINPIALQILNAIDYLHDRSIIHFDLKPSNILHKDGKIKLIDFGSANFHNESIEFYDFTNSYSSLEYLLGYRYARPCKDMWSFGCILYELVSGKQMFDGESSISIILQILRTFGSPRNYENIELKHTQVININNYKPLDFESKFKDVDSRYLELIIALLELDPEDRIDVHLAYQMLGNIPAPSRHQIKELGYLLLKLQSCLCNTVFVKYYQISCQEINCPASFYCILHLNQQNIDFSIKANCPKWQDRYNMHS